MARFACYSSCLWDSFIAQLVKNVPGVQETWIRFLDREDPLEKEMATHFSILAWRIPWTEEPGGPQSWDCKELDTTEQLSTYLIGLFHLSLGGYRP